MSFQADLAQADSRTGPLEDLLRHWLSDVKRALPADSRGDAALPLAKSIGQIAWIDLAVMKAKDWDPDQIMAAMFQEQAMAADEWSKILSKQIEAKTARDFLKWFMEAQKRLLVEGKQALDALQEADEKDVEYGIQALIGESFAACVIATKGTGKSWNAVLEAGHE